MKIKYFEAESKEAAIADAAKFFACTEEALTIEIVSGSEGSLFWLILAVFGMPSEIEDMNGSFKLFYEEDGVFLELYEKRGGGVPLDRAELSSVLRRKEIKGLDGQTALSLVTKGRGRAKIAPPQEEFFYGEDVIVEVAGNELEAAVKILEPEKGGAQITYEQALEKVKAAGIVHGFEEQLLRKALIKKDYGNPQGIAKATPPVDGEDGRLVFHFETDKKLARPKEIERGKVDYKDLDLYESVEEGQLLVSRELATPGTPGISVLGKELKQKPGKEVNLPKSKNVTISEDRLQMFSKLTGLVEFIGGSVNVSNVYKVTGDCGLSVGNIDFDGSVHITGNVISGHIIKATGGVVVGGVVEASEIIAGGNVEVKRGMQGMDKGRIEAAGSISILYIERGTAVAGESVTLDASIHSTVEAGKSIYAKGKRGSIIGGLARAGGEIVAGSVGSVSHAQTEIEVGFSPQKRARIALLEEELKRITAELEKLETLGQYLEKAKEKMDSLAWEKHFNSMIESKRVDTELFRDYTEELGELKYEAENAIHGKVHVTGTAYPGVKITIASGTYKVNNEQKFSTFKYKDGEIMFLPCEVSRG